MFTLLWVEVPNMDVNKFFSRICKVWFIIWGIIVFPPFMASANQPKSIDSGTKLSVDLSRVFNQVRTNQSWKSANFPVISTGVVKTSGNGVMIPASKGAVVRNWLTGRVEHISVDSDCGLNVVIRSGPWHHRYCSLQGTIIQEEQGNILLSDIGGGIRIQRGQYLEGGRAVGRVTSGSNSSQSFLHWQVKYQGHLVNPNEVLQIMESQQRISRIQEQDTPEYGNPGVNQANPIIPQPQVLALRQAIIGQESDNNPTSVNPHSGALGLGQIMPENLPSWSQAALGYTISREEFLKNPQLQLRIIDYKLTEFWQGAWERSRNNEVLSVRMVAAQWYSGDPTLYDQETPETYDGHPYPSIREYTLAVLARYQTYRVATR